MVIVRRAVDGLRDALAVGIVAVGDCLAGLVHSRELAAVLPCVGPRAVAQEVADLIRRQALPVDAREQVAPACIAVAVGDGAHRRAEGSGRIGVLRLAQDVPAVIVGIRPRLPRRLVVLPHKLVEAVVGVGRCALAVGDGCDVPACVVGVGIRRRAGLPRPDLPRGRCGRGIVVADRGLDHGLSAALRVHRGHPPQRVVGVARGDGSLRRFRQAVVRSGAKRSFYHILHQNGHSPAFTLAARMRKTALFPAGSAGRNTAPGRDVCAPSPTR